MKATEQSRKERSAHHDALQALAKSLGVNADGLTLWRKLNRIEQLARKAAERYCNGEIDGESMDQAMDEATQAVKRVFGGTLPPGFHVNRDPRGYALKLLSTDAGDKATEFNLYRDWGNNQILAPFID